MVTFNFIRDAAGVLHTSTVSRTQEDGVRRLLWVKEFLNKFFAILETAKAGYGLKYVRITVIFSGQNTRLDDRHHWQLQFQFPSATSGATGYHPRVAMDLSQLWTLQTNTCAAACQFS